MGNIIIFVFLHGLGRLTCSGIDALPSLPRASTNGKREEKLDVLRFKVISGNECGDAGYNMGEGGEFIPWPWKVSFWAVGD